MVEARVRYKKAAALGIIECSVQPGAHALGWEGRPCRHDGSSRPIQEGSRPGNMESQYMLANILRTRGDCSHRVRRTPGRGKGGKSEQWEEEEEEAEGEEEEEKKKEEKEEKKEEQATTREESLAPSIEPVAAAVCSLKDAGDVTGRGVPESTQGGETTCIVCFKGDKTHIAVPCGHWALCGPCSAKLDVCPICRAKAQLWMQVHIA